MSPIRLIDLSEMLGKVRLFTKEITTKYIPQISYQTSLIFDNCMDRETQHQMDDLCTIDFAHSQGDCVSCH